MENEREDKNADKGKKMGYNAVLFKWLLQGNLRSLKNSLIHHIIRKKIQHSTFSQNLERGNETST